MNNKYGFSLIELMIVIAIIGILASIGIPAYGDYLIRSRVTELVSGAAGVQKAVEEYGIVNSGFSGAATLTSVGATDPATATGSIANTALSDANATNVWLHVCGRETKLGITTAGDYLGIVFKATYSNGAVQWQCQYKATSAALAKYVPATCRVPTDATTQTACTTIQ